MVITQRQECIPGSLKQAMNIANTHDNWPSTTRRRVCVETLSRYSPVIASAVSLESGNRKPLRFLFHLSGHIYKPQWAVFLKHVLQVDTVLMLERNVRPDVVTFRPYGRALFGC